MRNGLYKLLLGSSYDPESKIPPARDVIHRHPSPEELKEFEADPQNPNLGPSAANFTIHIYGPTGTFSHKWNQKGLKIARHFAYPPGTNASVKDFADYASRYETAWGYLRQLADNPPESKTQEQRRIQVGLLCRPNVAIVMMSVFDIFCIALLSPRRSCAFDIYAICTPQRWFGIQLHEEIDNRGNVG